MASSSSVIERSMLDSKLLLTQLQAVRQRIEADLRERAASVPEIQDRLSAEYEAARQAKRTGEAFGTWCEDVYTQAAVAWILGGVFVRFLEDNALIDPVISGPGDRRQRAVDREELYFRQHPTDSYRDYLQDVFSEVAGLPAAERLFDPRHNPLWAYPISGDAAKELLQFWRKRNPDTNELLHDFTDPTWDTRFLGDLYQDLSEAARKRYALLQTPEFVEEFILDRALDPAIEEFGLAEVRLIDPTCGSGHFLLGAFRRILDRWFRTEPGTAERELVQRSLDAVNGIDLNPYAAAIARFRLTVAALKASRITRLNDAPGYRINVAAGDSLLHGPIKGQQDLGGEVRQEKDRGFTHGYFSEDLDEVYRILAQSYHVVVGNPPYITVKDKALNQAYRDRYSTCHRQYSLGVPFTERFFDLALNADNGAGFVGMITADSFMKREFGKKLIEELLPFKDLTHVAATSGAYIPGHGTPTVILFGRNREPVSQVVRTVMAKRGEPEAPADPSKGKVWTAILDQVDRPGSESEFLSVADLPRESFRKHPWSIGGGGAADLRTIIEEAGTSTVDEVATAIGRTTHTGEDEAFYMPRASAATRRMASHCVPVVLGEDVRDFTVMPTLTTIFPYDRTTATRLPALPGELSGHLWPNRVRLRLRKDYGQFIEDRGFKWFEHSMFFPDRFRTALSIAFPFVASHNHFVLDRGTKVFNRTSPVIKLAPNATEEAHLSLLGLLNSSTACFWLKQVCFPKGGDHQGDQGARVRRTWWDERYEHDAGKVGQFPIIDAAPLDISRSLDSLSQRLASIYPSQFAAAATPTKQVLAKSDEDASAIRGQMIALQEELDWRCYQLYGLLSWAVEHPNPPPLQLGQRAFEIIMARQLAAGELETTWFERHGSTPITRLPDHWPDDYKAIVERRIQLIESEPFINLIERPEYKRRWAGPSWKELERGALRGWLLDRLETSAYWPETRPRSTREIANQAQADAEFLQVAELYVGQAGFDVPALIAELLAAEAAPFLPVLRYKESGRRKRTIWEETWDKQRQEDAVDAQVEKELTAREGESDEAYGKRLAAEQKRRKKDIVGDIPAPPKYQPVDFLTATCWKLRGPLDVPKERFISYPFCSREGDSSLVVGWAGWDHLGQARAIAAWYTDIVDSDGWSAERRKPLLAGLDELIPWLKQWHNDIDPEYGERMGDFYEGYLKGQLQALGLTREDLRTWQPPAAPQGGRRRRN